MPQVVRRVYVRRVARIATGLVLSIGGAGVLAAARSSELNEALAGMLPGAAPAVIATLLLSTLVAALAAYFAARSIAEQRYTVAMSRTVLPGSNLHHDIERLSHEYPDAIARQMAGALEAKALAVPIAGLAAVLPATALWLKLAIDAEGWPSLDLFETQAVAYAGPLAAVAVFGVAVALLTTFRGIRRRILRNDPFAAGDEINVKEIARRVWAGARAVYAAMTIANARHLVRATGSALRKRPGRGIALGAAVALAVGTFFAKRAAEDSQAAPAAQLAAPPLVAHPGSVLRSPWVTSRTADDGSIEIEAHIRPGGEPLRVDRLDALDGLSIIPAGWQARIQISVIETPINVFVTPLPAADDVVPRHFTQGSEPIEFAASSCFAPQPIGLQITSSANADSAEFVVRLRYTISLSPVACP